MPSHTSRSRIGRRRLLGPAAALVLSGCADLFGPGNELPVCGTDHSFVLDSRLARTSVLVRGAGQFPVAVSMGSSSWIVFRGRGGHLGVDGRLDIVDAHPPEEDFGNRRIVAEGETDQRNPAFGIVGTTLLLAHVEYDAYDSLGVWDRIGGRMTPFIKRSDDAGTTWTPRAELDVRPYHWASPYGRIITVGSTTILPMYGGYFPIHGDAGKRSEQRGFFSFVLRSHDGGRSWGAPELVAERLSETAITATATGDLLAAMRDDIISLLILARRTAGSASWQLQCQMETQKEVPGDLTTLPDGRIVLSYGVRHPPYGIGMRVSRTDGRTWSRPAMMARDGADADIGYPSSVVVGDALLTAYYVDYDAIDDRGKALMLIRTPLAAFGPPPAP